MPGNFEHVIFPGKLKPLVEGVARYKVAHGGRGSAKSWSFARKLLLMGGEKPLRILCCREVQRSIKESVHRLLSDMIQDLGLGSFYLVLDNEIRGLNGTIFSFAGLATHTVESIKSYEGYDIVWVEEGQTVSKRSWDVLTPTIRKAGSEIWISMNPVLDTDETYKRFVLNPPPGSIVVEINWWDNPWFTKELEAERAHAEATMTKEDYQNIWEGKPRSAVIGAIYAAEVDAMIRNRQVTQVPYDPMLPVHTVWDLGWADSMFISLVQRAPTHLRVIHVIEDDHRTLDSYAKELNEMELHWGYDFLPHDGRVADFRTGKTPLQLLKKLGRNVYPSALPQLSIEAGIKLARMLFPRIYVDVEYGARLVECLKRYRRAIHATTGEEGPPVHDEYSHGCLVAGSMVETKRGLLPIEKVAVGDQVVTPVGFAQVTKAGVAKIADTLIEITTEDGRSVTVTPEHKFFTTSGIVVADTLRYADGLVTAKGSQCEISSGLVNRIGYRAAFSETMQACATGSGRNAGTTSRRSPESMRSCTEWFTRTITGFSSPKRRFTRLMGIGKTLAQKIWASASGRRVIERENIRSKSSMALSTTGSLAVTSRQTTSPAVSTCTGLYGRFTTERFLPGTTSTMSMAIARTTRSAILNCCPQAITRSTMLRRTIGLGAMRIGASLLKRLSLLRHGTGARKAASGIQETAGKPGGKDLGLRSRARFAGKSTAPHGRLDPSSVTRIAELRRFAADDLVYDLTVEHHHCYFANGLLVSNSDNFRYIAMAESLMSNEALGASAPKTKPYRPRDRVLGV